VGRRRVGAIALLVVLAQAAVLESVALLRFVDGDEGVYAYAGRLAVHGELPYRDFFYEQTPLLPYVYGCWAFVVGESWYALRTLSVVAAVAVGLLLYLHLRAKAGVASALVAAAIYGGSALVFGFFTLVKTFAVSGLLVFAAYFLAASGRRWLLVGVLLGLAVDTRLLLAAVLPVFAVAAHRARRLPPLSAGIGAAIAPTLVLVALDPAAFFFDNVSYHSLKSSGGLVGDFHQKAQTAATLLGFEPTDRALGLQFAVLIVAALGALALPRVRRRALFPLGIALSLAVASILPTPTYVQYFALTVPFFAVAAAEVAAVGSRAAVAVAAALYLLPAGWAVDDFTRHDPLLRPSLATVDEVARRVDAAARPGDKVLSSWPGYLVGTHAWAESDYTNQFAPVAAAKISAADARRFHVVTERQLERRIRQREPRIVVYRNWVTSPPFARWDAALRAGRYRLVATVRTARIYTR
jgi:hypothetical protein